VYHQATRTMPPKTPKKIAEGDLDPNMKVMLLIMKTAGEFKIDSNALAIELGLSHSKNV